MAVCAKSRRALPSADWWRSPLARQFGAEVEKVCAPVQFALSTRAGMDCVGREVRLATDLDPRATVLSIDGVGAYDHVLRSAMVGKMLEVDSHRGRLPFARATYAEPSCYHWQDDHGRVHQIRQHEGGEQCRSIDATVILFSSAQCVDGCAGTAPIFAFLDDVYALSATERTCTIYKLLKENLFATAGIRLHTKKTRTWNRASRCRCDPRDHGRLGRRSVEPHRDQHFGDSSEFGRIPPSLHTREVGRRRSVVASHTVGTRPPMGVAALFPVCQSAVQARPAHRASQPLGSVCGRPRMEHASDHGNFVGRNAWGREPTKSGGRQLAMRMGGLGSRSAARNAPAAFWASWSDALHMIHRRLS